MGVIQLLMLLTLGAAPAPDAATAKAHKSYERGQQLYAQARYAEAIASFEEAFRIKPNPVIYFNIGRCHEQSGDVARALRAYRDYLHLLPAAKDKDNVADRIANLERRLMERGLQQLMVFASPSNAYIEVDGKLLGTSPASVELVAGSHQLLVRADGFEPTERSFVMQIQRASELTVNLRPRAAQGQSLPSPPVVAAEQPKADAPLAPQQPSGVSLSPQPSGASNDLTLSGPVAAKPRLGVWVGGGTAVAAAGAGLGLGLAAQAKAASVATARVGSARETASAAQGLALGANIAYGVAGAAAIAAVVLFFVEK
jgi:hypothetical protein